MKFWLLSLVYNQIAGERCLHRYRVLRPIWPLCNRLEDAWWAEDEKRQQETAP